MENEPIKTSIGLLVGRDAIYLDGIEHNYGDRTVVFSGEINATLASDYHGIAKWLGYRIAFAGVDALRMTELDCYDNEVHLASSFDRVPVPTMGSRIESCQQYVLATYDHVFELMAIGHEFIITGERQAEQDGADQPAAAV